MSDAGLVLGLAFCSMGLLLIGLSIPLVLRRVTMNPLYGVRIAKAYESDANWYAVNAYGGRIMAIAGAVVLVVGVLLMVFPPSSLLEICVVSIVPVPIVLLALVPILRFAKRL